MSLVTLVAAAGTPEPAAAPAPAEPTPIVLVAAAGTTAGATAGENAAVAVREFKRIQVNVASVSGRNVYLTRGRAAGITPGLRVRLQVPGEAPVEAQVADVTTNSARVEIPEGLTVPPVGTICEVELPDEQKPAEQTPEQPAAPKVPEHPPWARKEDEHGADQPLLAPAFARPAKDRPAQVRGRVFVNGSYTRDQGGGRSNDYWLARVGTSIDVTNPFKQGGRLSFAGEFDHRGTSLLNNENNARNDLIIDRLSYAWGDEDYSPHRYEVGRFTSIYLPEIGLLDGGEMALRLDSGLNVGGGIGAYPRAFPDRAWGDDFGFHVFADYQSKETHHLASTLGYQKTWHEGAADRDLIIGRLNVRPTKSWWLFGSFKADINTPGDPVKSAGPHLTEAWAQARYTPDSKKGVSFSYSHFTWPDLKREEFEFLPAELVAKGHVDRFDVSGWHDIVKDVKATGRVNYWVDQKGDGWGGEAGLDWDNAFHSPVTLHGDVFYSEGSSTTGEGFRIEGRASKSDVSGFLGYELYQYTTTGLVSGDETFIRNTIRAGVSWQSGRFSYNLTADHNFGEGEDSYTLNAYVEMRF